MKRSSKNRLTQREAILFPGDNLFDKIARTVCMARVLPRKELYEAWEVARRIRRKYRGGRIVDLACGHGLLAHILMILDDSSPEALAVDTAIPKNAIIMSKKITETWPRLKERVHYVQAPLQEIPIQPDDLVVSVHACGTLTDQVMEKALSAGARLAILPCCHDLHLCDTGNLCEWVDGPLAVDIMRVYRLKYNGYTVMAQKIPGDITPKNRLILSHPSA